MDHELQAMEVAALKQRLLRLEAENKAFSRELRRFKRRPSRLWGLTLLAFGGLSLAAGTAYSSLIPAFIGLGLTLWGALLLYIRPVRYIRQELLDSTTTETPSALRQLIEETGYRGKSVFLPPKTLGELGTSTLLISRSDEVEARTEIQAIQATNTPILSNPGLTLIPPGLGLARLIQDELGRNLATADFDYLANNLPRVLIEDLEIADDAEIEHDAGTISVRLRQPLLCTRSGGERPELDYLPGAIACALTWVTGKPVTIESLTRSDRGKAIEARYRVLEA